jgi:ketosteroid isomerase-like protein
MPEAAPTRLQLAQQFMDSISRYDADGAAGLLSPKAIYRVEGANALSGTFSADEIVNHLLSVFRRTSGTLDATKFDDWLIGDYHVVCLFQVTFHAAGRRYSGQIVYLFRFDNEDRIDKVNVFFEDPDAFSRFIGM